MVRSSIYASAAVLALGGVACLAGASGEWSDRSAMVGSDAAEAAEQAAFVAELYAIGALYLASSLTLLLLRTKWTWWLVLCMQAALFALAIVEGMLTDPLGWTSFSGLPLATLVLLVAIRIVQGGLQRNMAGSAPSASAPGNASG